MGVNKFTHVNTLVSTKKIIYPPSMGKKKLEVGF